MLELISNKNLGHIIPNIATLLKQNAEKFSDNIVFQQKNEQGNYESTTWKEFYTNIQNIAFNLINLGFTSDDKIVLFSRNNLKMLQLELAVMSVGAVAVPIFSNFNKETAK